ncbi:EDD domain protein, DegV family [Dietzia kunjamensis subsp. schimae]|uniref:DegV family protein n=3 Tax=Bacteria TaxID=2 RepID=A0ABT8GYZ8_9ACTN|nr:MULTISPECIES: DegV family protein [Dietzia]MBB0991711.1 DegV family protein [Dietzia sp. SLG510A3-30A2]MBB1013013.1 DegV family protein [Dietzia kunjamensis]MBB1015684.1 DegV family protein [Dietzia kunjamensis subsp. schimae]MBB1017035.1 DegV family protein [Dietzia sp. DQ11-71]MDJ0422130.1 DegV family protein [Dietzia kunjamensis]
MTIRLVTDSSADLPAEWVRGFGITVVGLHVVEENDRAVSTAAVTPDELAEIYGELLADPDCTGVVSVHLSRELSRTWQSAADAATRFGGRVLVSDSRGAGMAFGAAVAQCAWAAGNGLGLSATYELAERLCRGASTYAALESLENLRRGGRISALAALFGSALAMRPVIVLRNGSVDLAAKARTTTKAHARLRSLLRDDVARGDVLVVVHHHQARERAEEMATEIRKETQFPERVMIVEFDEVLAWHLGPGTVGVSVTDLVDTEFPILPPSPQPAD